MFLKCFIEDRWMAIHLDVSPTEVSLTLDRDLNVVEVTGQRRL